MQDNPIFLFFSGRLSCEKKSMLRSGYDFGNARNNVAKLWPIWRADNRQTFYSVRSNRNSC